MRVAPELADAMVAAGFREDIPTLFLSECVLVYMQAMHGDSIIKWCASAVSSAPSAMIVYEQFNPNDPFGTVMVENLMQRGCPLLSIFDYPTLESQRDRYLQRGWEQCWMANMNEVYSKYLDEKDVERIHKLEMMDEFEEWHLIQAHYFILIATRSGSEAAGEDKVMSSGSEPDSSWIHGIAPAPTPEGSPMPSGGYGGTSPAATIPQSGSLKDP
jgi:tRNA wybutosine-synthesizing protein 4